MNIIIFHLLCCAESDFELAVWIVRIAILGLAWRSDLDANEAEEAWEPWRPCRSWRSGGLKAWSNDEQYWLFACNTIPIPYWLQIVQNNTIPITPMAVLGPVSAKSPSNI